MHEVPVIENGGIITPAVASGSGSRVRVQQVVDIEEIVSDTGAKEYRGVHSGGCGNRGDLCSSKFHCTEAQRETCELTVKEYNEHITSEELDDSEVGNDQQILRHVVLLLLIVTSLFVVRFKTDFEK